MEKLQHNRKYSCTVDFRKDVGLLDYKGSDIEALAEKENCELVYDKRHLIVCLVTDLGDLRDFHLIRNYTDLVAYLVNSGRNHVGKRQAINYLQDAGYVPVAILPSFLQHYCSLFEQALTYLQIPYVKKNGFRLGHELSVADPELWVHKSDICERLNVEMHKVRSVEVTKYIIREVFLNENVGIWSLPKR